MRRAFFLLPIPLTGCWLSHALSEPGEPGESPCAPDASGAQPTCVRPAEVACGAAAMVAAECDEELLQWRCPAGTRRYEAVAAGQACLPFAGSDSIARLSGAPVPVPTDDGCVWLLPELETASGERVAYAAVRLDETAPFGTCPATPDFLEPGPVSAVRVLGDAPPELLPSVTGAFRLPGAPTRVAFRNFVWEEGAPFGLRELGTGLGVWSETEKRVWLPDEGAIRWPPEVDLGDAVVAVGESAYLYGCPPPIDFLTEDCVLARLDGALRAELWTDDGWVAEGEGWDGTTVDEAPPLFDAGPWRSAVTRIADGRFLHLYAVGFGSRIEGHVAPAPEGPWTSLGWIAECDLPADDDEAFCAGPAVHPELQDPLRPGEIVVSYDVATTSPDWEERRRASPESYWPRLVSLVIP
ncbi:MAG: hypothetical protein HYY06_18720 [Deltaproteobacteria bacterium]|nr:hypothetical protein [Deltaproteobacteria bacterium]